jgi:hypothetical protein
VISEYSPGAFRVRGNVSVSGGQLSVFKATFFVLAAVAAIWLVAVGALVFALQAFVSRGQETTSVANGSIYMSAFALTLIINVAIIFPALLLLQPLRLWRVMRSLRHAITPRQRFRGEPLCTLLTLSSSRDIKLFTHVPTTRRSRRELVFWPSFLHLHLH